MPANKCYPVAAAALALLIAGVFVPTPLYELYRRQWGLTPEQISLVFAVYAGSAIPSLLFLGGLSDRIGRVKALILALGVAATAAAVFGLASGFWWLVAGRILQGVSIGIGIPTASAAIREWMPESMRSSAGMVTLVGTGAGSIFGALLGGSLAQYAPLPTRLPFAASLILLVVLCVVVAAVPTCPRIGAAAHENFPTVPRAIRRPFFVGSAASFMGWAGVGIFASLVPSFLARSLNDRNLLIGGLVVLGMQLGTLTSPFAGRSLPNRIRIIAGLIALGAGFWALLLGVHFREYAMLGVAVYLVGIGSGWSYLAGLNVVNRIASPEHRAELLSLFFVASYLGFSIPALSVGIVANRIGLYGAIVACAISLGPIAIALMWLTTNRNLQAGSPAGAG